MRSTLLKLVLAACGIAHCSQMPAQTAAMRGDIASRRVPEFSAKGVPLLNALLQLGRDADVPLGIEFVDVDALHDRVNITLENKTFREVLDAILQSGQGYIWSAQHGVIFIQNQKLPLAPSSNLLEFVISEYALTRPTTLAEANMLLLMELDVRIHGTQGFAGSYNPGDVRKKIDPLRLTNKTVADILNTIVGSRKHAAWIAAAPPNKLAELPSSGLWKIIEYSGPARDYASELRQLPQFQAAE